MIKKTFLTWIIFALTPVLLTAAPCGDVNSSGNIDIVDALIIAQYSVNWTPSAFDQAAADVNGDGVINIVDALVTAQYYVGLIPALSGCVTPEPTPPEGYQTSTDRIEGESYKEMQGIEVESCEEGGENIGYIENGDYLMFHINFNSLVSQIQVRGASNTTGGTIEIRVDSLSGEIIGTAAISRTGGWQSWKTFSSAISEVSGYREVYLIFKGESGYLFNLNWFTFAAGTPAPTPPPAYNLVVAKDGSGNYSTVQSAINAVPDNGSSWFTIYIKKGTYKEVIDIPATKTYLRLIGEEVNSTVLTYDNSHSIVGSTSGSASVFVYSTNFIAQDITFENSFDYYNSTTDSQAVALETLGDRQIYINCRFLGHQDTLYIRQSKCRQYFTNCFITGVVDFIFGAGTAVFDNCEIRVRGSGGSIIAAPKTDASVPFGLVFLNCQLTTDTAGRENSTSLGRPWGQDGACHYLYCNLGVHCAAWADMSSNIWQNARFGEYKNTGPGVEYNSNHPQLSDAQAANYTVTNIMKGSDNWNPKTVIASMN